MGIYVIFLIVLVGEGLRLGWGAAPLFPPPVLS